jgi:long-chain acyl-CoA synthetase
LESINKILENSAEKFPNKPAIIFENKEITYEEILQKSQFLSNFIQEKTTEGNVISILHENSPFFIISYFAILKSGCIAHIIPPSISDHNLQEQIQQTNPKIILSNSNFKHKLKRTELIKQSYFIENDSKFLKSNENDFYGNRFCKTSSIIFTSGTTSKPKGVKLTHKNVLTATKNIVNIMKLQSNDIEINSLSLSHSFGLGCIHANFLQSATSIIFKNTINLKEILRNGKTQNCTGFVGVPATFYQILNSFTELFSTMSSIRYMLTNTAPMEKKSINEVIDLLPNANFYTYYGLTEASRSTILLFNENKNKLESVGKAANGVEIKILDDNGKHLSSKQIGEIFIKGDHVIDNYWNNSKADESINQGWIKTGDLGCFDSDKFLYLKSRKDDLLNVGGEKFTPEEVESVIKEISEIKDAAVIGIPNEIFGQIPIAFVVTKNELSSKQIINHCSKKLERYKIPQKIVVLEKIPKTDSGKIKRNILKSKFIQ